VTGLMDPPYTSSKHHYTHLSVTVEEGQQLHLIEESEARFRLGNSGSSASPPKPSIRSNREVLQSIKHGGPGSERSPPASAPRSAPGRVGTQPRFGAGQSAPRTGNQAILQQIKATAAPEIAVSGPPTQVGSGATPRAPQRDGCTVGCLIVIVVAGILFAMARS
jgi:hypothetical protein